MNCRSIYAGDDKSSSPKFIGFINKSDQKIMIEGNDDENERSFELRDDKSLHLQETNDFEGENVTTNTKRLAIRV